MKLQYLGFLPIIISLVFINIMAYKYRGDFSSIWPYMATVIDFICLGLLCVFGLFWALS